MSEDRIFEKKLPSELVKEVITALEEIKRQASETSQQAGRAQEIMAAGESCWRGLDSRFQNGETDDVLTSGYQFLESLDEEVQSVKLDSRGLKDRIQSMAGSVDMYADVTGSTGASYGCPMSFDFQKMQQVRFSFDQHEEYAVKLGRLDQSLAKTFRSVKQSYYGSPEDNLRQALFAARQTFDHFFDNLVDDDEVRKQTWWKPEDPAKPEMVTRAQRMTYAAKKYVRDEKKQKVLLSGTQHAIDVYSTLNLAHKRGSLGADAEKAKSAIFEMVNIIKAWIDAIDWGN